MVLIGLLKKWFSLPAEIYGNVIVDKHDYEFTLPTPKHKPDSVKGSGNETVSKVL